MQRSGSRAASNPLDTTLIVMVHASGGSYRQAPQSGLGPRLAIKGYAPLAINTRQHDDKINTDNFLEVRRPLQGARQSPIPCD
jgi:hypothetical protein